MESAESGVEGAESGVEEAGSGGRGGGKRGWRGRGAWKDCGGKLIFFYRKFKENGSFRPISNINFEVAASKGVEDDAFTLK